MAAIDQDVDARAGSRESWLSALAFRDH